MTKIRSIVVDDETPARQLAVALLSPEDDIEVIAESGCPEEAIKLIVRKRPDLLLLDVQMPGLTGFDVLRTVREETEGSGYDPIVIFATGHPDFARRAFEADAVHYLVKPYDDLQFADAIDRARRRIVASRLASVAGATPLIAAPAAQGGYWDRLPVRKGTRTYYLRTGQIEWIEAEGDTLRVHLCGDGNELVDITLTRLEQRLDPAQFIRVSRSAIVKIDAVQEVISLDRGRYTLRLSCKAAVDTTSTYAERLREVLLLKG